MKNYSKYREGLAQGYRLISFISMLEDDTKLEDRMNLEFLVRFEKYKNETAPVSEFRQEAVAIVEVILREWGLRNYCDYIRIE